MDVMPHYREAGQGPPVFLLHAFPLSHTMWEEQMSRLKRRFHVVTPDAFGFGLSALPSEPWDIAALARGCLAVADRLGFDSFSLVGLSMGGYAAFEILRQTPERVSRLVLANTRARADTTEERQARADLASDIGKDGARVLVERMTLKLLRREPAAENVELIQSMIRHVRPAAAAYALSALAGRADSTAILSGIACPTIVIAGAEDAITTADEARSMADAIPGCRFIEIPNAGHLTNIENPDAFTDEVEGFLLVE